MSSGVLLNLGHWRPLCIGLLGDELYRKGKSNPGQLVSKLNQLCDRLVRIPTGQSLLQVAILKLSRERH